MKFAAGITLYNPTDEDISNIKGLSSSFDKIFLFDNSDQRRNMERCEFGEKFEIISEGENKGLPYAFNKIIERCSDYDFLCTLDQDSVFDDTDISAIKNYIEKSDDLGKKGVISPYIDYGYETITKNESVEEVEWAITSGSFVNLSITRKENLHYDDNYFIDRMEVDMCKQLKSLGYLILVYHGSVLHQTLGEASGHRHPNHSVLRNYYMFRNRFYFNDKWYSGAKKLFLNLSQTLRHIYLILMFEKEKTKKIVIMREAYSDYKNRKMGKKNERKDRMD